MSCIRGGRYAVVLGTQWFLQGLHPSQSTLLDADKLFGNFVKKGLVLHIETISTSSPSQPPTNCYTVRFAGLIF